MGHRAGIPRRDDVWGISWLGGFRARLRSQLRVLRVGSPLRRRLLLWDGWGATQAEGPEIDVLADDIARLLVAAAAGDEAAETDLAARYADDDRLHPPAEITTYSPYGMPPRTTVLAESRGHSGPLRSGNPAVPSDGLGTRDGVEACPFSVSRRWTPLELLLVGRANGSEGWPCRSRLGIRAPDRSDSRSDWPDR